MRYHNITKDDMLNGDGLREKTIWMYTGFVWESIDGLEVMDYVDVLVDGEFVKEEADPQLHWKGSANQRVIDVKATKKSGEVVLHCA